ncbi:MAG: aspartate aminotransferase family protein [Myxococcales bacterium]|nr:aspartate aminotransferase family protein [Myxococcales bacterium]
MPQRFGKEKLEELARKHLWVYFSQLTSDARLPIIVRGEGCHIFDAEGKRYLDGLAGLFLSNVGHGRKELADAAYEQMTELHFFPLWNYTHPRAIELAAKLAELAPGDLNRVFFTTGGGEAVETAWKLARQYFRAIGQPERHKIISRQLAYHGTTMGALAITGVEAIKTPYEPLAPGAFHARHTSAYRAEAQGDALGKLCADDIERVIVEQGPETVAAVILEPVQNSGGCFPPPPGYFRRVREICDRHGVLLVSDEVICAFGRLGHMLACDRYDYVPDIIICAKGLTSGYAPVGAAIVSDRLVEPFVDSDLMFLHGMTYGGHPVGCAVGLANIEILEREDLPGRVRKHEDAFLQELRRLEDLPIVGDIRGAGYFYGIELVKDKETQKRFSPEECNRLLRDFLSHRLFELGLICRAEDKGEPVVQLAPPLIAGPEEFSEIATILRQALSEAWDVMS